MARRIQLGFRLQGIFVGAALLSGLASGTGWAQEPNGTLLSPLNVNGLVTAGRATVSGSRADTGQLANLFDGKVESLYVSNNTNPETVEVVLAEPKRLHGFRLHFSHAAGNPAFRWSIETAQTQADMQGRNGSFQEVVPPTETAGGVFSEVPLATPVSAKIVRLKVQRLTGDNYVHIDEWALLSEDKLTKIIIAAPNQSLPQFTQKRFQALGDDAQDLSGRVTWRSDNVQVATVDSTGLVQAVAPGQARISATLGALTTQRTLQVGPPDAADLDVTFIERTPRYEYDAPKNNPAPGDMVTFRGHVQNWGRGVRDVEYRWLLDGKEVDSGAFKSDEAEHVLEWKWQWEGGPHTVGLWVDPNSKIAEQSEANNRIVDRTDALAMGFWVEQSIYDYFRARQKDLGIGSNSWEDWAQRQVTRWNNASANAVWATSPQGVTDRARLDNIVIVPDGALPLKGGLPSNNPTQDKHYDLMWGFNTKLLEQFYRDTRSLDPDNMFFNEASLVHELGHARYLLDHYNNDIGEDSPIELREQGQPLYGSPYLPEITAKRVYNNQFGGLMTGAYDPRLAWSPLEAMALNRIAGQRASKGNQNAPGNYGEFTQDIAKRTHIQLVEGDGTPLAGAKVGVFYRGEDKGFRGRPDLNLQADDNGTFVLNAEQVKPIVLLRIQQNNRVYFRFLEVYAFNMARWRDGAEDANLAFPIFDETQEPAIAIKGFGQRLTPDAPLSAENGTDLGTVPFAPTTLPDEATKLLPHVTRAFEVQNVGGGRLQVQEIRVSGPHASDFTVTPLNFDLTTGALRAVSVTFVPQALGVREATVTLVSNASNGGSFSFKIRGTGTAASVPEQLTLR